ncbi:hypothetical protein DC28_02115 [Spirochaeta lutea]|uniref:histidine kinase n=1 Tax=Spirochaeta lutea TaxID=1480694 RepID=A0A098R1X4_9SPIO|nr:hypothetical protein DC28_02115 [Spirochaeta lutea]
MNRSSRITINWLFALLITAILLFPGILVFYLERQNTKDLIRHGMLTSILTRYVVQYSVSHGVFLPVDLIPRMLVNQRIQIYSSQGTLLDDSGWIYTEELDLYNDSHPEARQDFTVTPEAPSKGTLYRRYLYVRKEFPSHSPLKGYVVAISDKAEVMARKDAIQNLVYIYMFCALGASAGIVYVLHKSITDPLRKLVACISSGDAESKELEKLTLRPDELGKIAAEYRNNRKALLEEHGRYINFSADIMHELKNPISGIRSGLEFLLGKTIRPGRRDKIRLLLEESARLDLLLNSIHELGKYETPMTSISEVTDIRCDPIKILKNLVDFYGSDNLIQESECRTGEIQINLPADDFGRVLRNLVDNALEYSPAGYPPRLICGAKADGLLIQVIDRGPGVPREEREKIFSRFYSSRTGEPASKHSGLGLTIAKSIVRRSGGTIRCKENPKGGTVFEIYLPLSSNHPD